MPTSVSTINPEIPTDEKLLGENNLVIASTDGYGICMAAAIGHYAKETGAKVEVNCHFPKNSPRNFWTGDGIGGPATINSIDPIKYNDVIIFGIVPNNYHGAESVQASAKAYEVFKAKAPGSKFKYAASRQRSEALDSSSLITDETETIESKLNQFYDEQNDRYPINLVKLARVCAKDRSVLQEFADPKELEYYETLALGVEISSRPSLHWHQHNEFKNSPETESQFREEFETEADRRVQETLRLIQNQNWNQLISEAETFRNLIQYPVITLTQEEPDGTVNMAFFETAGIPNGLQAIASEEVARMRNARYVISARFNPLDSFQAQHIVGDRYKIRIVKNWKNEDKNQIDIAKYRNKRVKVTGNRRFTSIELDDPNQFAATLTSIALEIEPRLNSVFAGISKIAIVGHPNRGKSSFAYKLAEYCKQFSGIENAERFDLADLVGITTNEFMAAMGEYYFLVYRKKNGVPVDQALLRQKQIAMEKQIQIREGKKQPAWTTEMLDLTRKRIDALSKVDGICIVDLAGGRPTKIVEGKIVEVNSEVPEIEMFLQSPGLQGVFIMGTSDEEINQWLDAVNKNNAIRTNLGLPPLKILGDLYTSDQTDQDGVSDYPVAGDEFHGRMVALSRKHRGSNSTIALLGALISTLSPDEV